VEDEIGDLKLELFKLRSQVEKPTRRPRRTAPPPARRGSRPALPGGSAGDHASAAGHHPDPQQPPGCPWAASPPPRPGASSRPRPTGPAGDERQGLTAAVLDYNRATTASPRTAWPLPQGQPPAAQRPDALFYWACASSTRSSTTRPSRSFEQIMREPSGPPSSSRQAKRGQCLQRMGSKPAAITAFKDHQRLPRLPEARTAPAGTGGPGVLNHWQFAASKSESDLEGPWPSHLPGPGRPGGPGQGRPAAVRRFTRPRWT